MQDHILLAAIPPEMKLKKLREYLFKKIATDNLFNKSLLVSFNAYLLITHNICFYCEKHVQELTIDHIIPRSKGGTNYHLNLIPCCEHCNKWKSSNTLEEWLLLVYTRKSQYSVDYVEKYNLVRLNNIIKNIKLLLNYTKIHKDMLLVDQNHPQKRYRCRLKMKMKKEINNE